MHIAKSLPDSIMLAHEDIEWIQPLDYEHIPFHCRKFHEHGHLFRDYPQNKLLTENKQTPPTNEEGFKKVTNKRKQGKKNPIVSKPSNPTTSNNFEPLATQHDEHATGEDGAPPAMKQLHQES